MPIENRNLKPGTHLVGRYHKQTYTCEVVEGEGGKLCYRLTDGQQFRSPSAAGMTITGHACDGWVFWSVQTTQTAPAPDAEQTEAQTEPATESIPTAEEPTPAKKRTIFRAPNQKGTGSQTRWYCQECGKSFLADMGVLPKTCPQGHQAT